MALSKGRITIQKLINEWDAAIKYENLMYIHEKSQVVLVGSEWDNKMCGKGGLLKLLPNSSSSKST